MIRALRGLLPRLDSNQHHRLLAQVDTGGPKGTLNCGNEGLCCNSNNPERGA
jgi:hypothetical protein